MSLSQLCEITTIFDLLLDREAFFLEFYENMSCRCASQCVSRVSLVFRAQAGILNPYRVATDDDVYALRSESKR